MKFDPSAFWPAFEAAGMLKLATVKQRSGGTRDVRVGFVLPDMPRLSGEGRSREYEIEYQQADLPKLAEGDLVTIWADDDKTSGAKYTVREAPFVAITDSDGYFRRALLSKA